MKILLKYPTRERPDLFAQTFAEWMRLADRPERLTWIVSLDADDPLLPSYRCKCDAADIDPIIGLSANKIAAVNRDLDAVRAAEWDVLVVVSDDMRPIVQGWDSEIDRHMSVLDMALWFVDGRRGDLCTLSIFGRPIFERMNCIYHPSFESVYADDYYHLVMEREGRMKRIGAPIIFEHQWKQGNNDRLMERNESNEVHRRDKARFAELKAKYLETGEAWAS